MTTLLRLAPIALLVACGTHSSTTGTGDGSAGSVSSAETAATTDAVQGMVLTTAPITTTSPITLAAAFRAQFVADGQACVTIDSDSTTFVSVTFACTGPLATTGTLDLQIASLTSVQATADLKIGGVAIDGSYLITIPASASAPRTLSGTLTIAGPRRELDATAEAQWTADAACVTYSASGAITAGGASASYQVDSKTACR